MKFNVVSRNWLKQTGQKIQSFLTPEFLADRPVRIILFWGLFLTGVTWLVSVLSFSPNTFQVPLRYNSFIGVTELGSWYELYTVPVILILCFFLNLILASVLYKKDRMISYIILGTVIFLGLAALTVTVNLRFIVVGA